MGTEVVQTKVTQTELVQTEVAEAELVWTKQLYYLVEALVTDLR